MTTFTDDKELIKEIKERIGSLDVRDNIERRAYEIALASLEAKKRLMEDTSATDAFLAEIERKAIRKFINSIEHILRDKLSPYDTEEMLEAMRIFLEEQGGEQK